MQFNFHHTLEILSATPKVLEHMLSGLSREWLYANEGGDTWSPHTVVGHLIFSEEGNWLPRMRKILSADDHRFVPFDPKAQIGLYKDHSIKDLLGKFFALRKNSLKELVAIHPDEKKLSRIGIHPDFGEVTPGSVTFNLDGP